jgi:hypothetical protein
LDWRCSHLPTSHTIPHYFWGGGLQVFCGDASFPLPLITG